MRTLLSTSRLLSRSVPRCFLCSAQGSGASVRLTRIARRSGCIRTLANVRDSSFSLEKHYFRASPSVSSFDHGSTPKDDRPPPDERTLKLGKTLRILHDHLPSVLEKPLPQDILSPQISLSLFPSTHPHLPAVSGRIPYTGALWTAPVAWGKLPVVGNVKLVIMSERMVRNGGTTVEHDCREEKLIVKWRTCGKDKAKSTGSLYRGIGAAEQVDRLTAMLRRGVKEDEVFCGLFIFEFDEEGRIAKHTIEHAEEGGNYDRASKVVSVTDWLLGKAPWNKHEEMPGLAWCENPRLAQKPGLPHQRMDHDR